MHGGIRRSFFLPILSIAINFMLAQLIRASNERVARQLLIAGIAANLLVLGYFKYADFFVSIVEGRKPVMPDIPLALSFTTFVQIAFLVDIWRRRGAVSLPIYALFVSFFPHLIAGPIVRWDELGPQLRDRLRYRADWNNIALGLSIFCLGLAKKVLIADKLSPHVAPVFDAAARGEALTAAAAWGAAGAYTAQLYFDFSGYSDMAVGLGLLFNLRLPINFAAPLRATSIIDLWRRWHITLSRFLRDFVYVPLGGAAGRPIRRSANLLITMVLGGLWHGANWTFVLWGAFHGVLLAANHLWRQWRAESSRRNSAVWPGGLRRLRPSCSEWCCSMPPTFPPPRTYIALWWGSVARAAPRA
jgi:alginate O-acetyltransferase complex protein AlgI